MKNLRIEELRIKNKGIEMIAKKRSSKKQKNQKRIKEEIFNYKDEDSIEGIENLLEREIEGLIKAKPEKIANIKDDAIIKKEEEECGPCRNDLNLNLKDFELLDKIASKLEKNITTLTEIQKEAIPKILDGKSLLIMSNQGAGRTYSYLISIINQIIKNEIKDQLYGIIIVYSKSNLKCFTSKLNKLLPESISNCFEIISGSVMNYSLLELKRVLKFPLLIGTPDLLLKLISNSKISQIEPQIIVFDDIDLMFQNSESDEINKIFNYFSSSGIQKILVAESQIDQYLKNIECDVSSFEIIQRNEQKFSPNVGNILLNYFEVPEDKRLLLLYTLLLNNLNKKIIVCFNSNISSNFYYNLFQALKFNVTYLKDDHSLEKKTQILHNYKEGKNMILMSTLISIIKMNLKKIDFIIQYECPFQVNEYLDTLKELKSDNPEAKAYLLLLGNEFDCLEQIKQNSLSNPIIVSELKYSPSKLINAQSIIEKKIKKSYFLSVKSREAYRDFVLNYNKQENKNIFNLKKLDFLKLSKSFGMDFPIKIKLENEETILSKKRRMAKTKGEVIFKTKKKKNN